MLRAYTLACGVLLNKEAITMVDEVAKNPKFSVVSDGEPSSKDQLTSSAAIPPETMAELDQDEQFLCELRVDQLGSSAPVSDSQQAIGVGRVPKDTFFRCRPGSEYQPEIQMVVNTVGFDRSYVAVMPQMVEYLRSIKIFTAKHRVYLITTEDGIYRLVPVRLASRDGSQNVFSRTLQIAMSKAETEWVRIYNDPELRDVDRGWDVFPAPPGRFQDPLWPDTPPGKMIRLGFKDSNNLIDSADHALVKKYQARA
jgi:hypothetical protein